MFACARSGHFKYGEETKGGQTLDNMGNVGGGEDGGAISEDARTHTHTLMPRD